MMRWQWVLGHIWMLTDTLIGLLTVLFGWCSFQGWAYDGSMYFLAKPGGIAYWWFKKYRFAAYACGGVIVFAEPEYRDNTIIKKHEHRHVRQAMMFGPFMPLAYGIASLVAIIRGQPAYEGNWFENDANAHDRLQEWP